MSIGAHVVAKIDFTLALLFGILAVVVFFMLGQNLLALGYGLLVAGLWAFASRSNSGSPATRWWPQIPAVVGSLAILWFDNFLTGH